MIAGTITSEEVDFLRNVQNRAIPTRDNQPIANRTIAFRDARVGFVRNQYKFGCR